MSDSLKQLFRRLQDDVGELGEALFGDRMERVLDQEIREVDQALHRARDDAAAIKAQRIAAQDALRTAQARLLQAEAEAAALLATRKRAPAREKAALIVEYRAALDELQRQAAEHADAEEQLAHLVGQLEHKLRRLKHQLGTLRATASIQRAQAAVAQRSAGAPHPETAQAPASRARARKDKPAATASARRNATPADPRDSAIDEVLRGLQARNAGNETTPAAPARGTGKRKPR